MSKPAQELDVNLFYRCEDMGMVVYLKIQGHQVQALDWASGKCAWIFDRSDLLEAAVDDFIAGDAIVDPREYNKIYTATKHELYDSNPAGPGKRQRQRY